MSDPFQKKSFVTDLLDSFQTRAAVSGGSSRVYAIYLCVGFVAAILILQYITYRNTATLLRARNKFILEHVVRDDSEYPSNPSVRESKAF